MADYDIEAFVGHLGNHFDEFAGGKQVRFAGARKWGPRVVNSWWELLNDPHKFTSQELIVRHRLPIGVCGLPYDEHGLLAEPGSTRTKYTSAARLVYDDLEIGTREEFDVYTRAAYQALVRYAVWVDRGTGVDWQALPNLIKRRWGLWFDMQGTDEQKAEALRELVWRCERDVDDYVDDSRVFYEALLRLSNTLEHMKLRVGDKPVHLGIVRAENPVADNRHIKNAAMSRKWREISEIPQVGVLFKRDSRGNVGIFTARVAELDMGEVVVAIRMAELAKRGIACTATRDELLREKWDHPWWHYLQGSQTLLNGSKDAARGVEKTALEDNEILAILEQKLQPKRIITTGPAVAPSPDHIEISGPVKASMEEVAGPVQELVLAVPGEDGALVVGEF